jgi:HD-GYP domain-containing protein (c-di-GMP phosphodiesterase class II)
MTSNQPYRLARPPSAARDEIVRWSGRQFDPEVVKVFLTISEVLLQSLRDERATLSKSPSDSVTGVKSLATYRQLLRAESWAVGGL